MQWKDNAIENEEQKKPYSRNRDLCAEVYHPSKIYPSIIPSHGKNLSIQHLMVKTWSDVPLVTAPG
jgi:hypothetical protein